VDEFDCPINPYISNYINSTLSMMADNTIKRYVEELLYVLKFFNQCSIDLIERAESGEFLQQYEYQNFYESSFSRHSINSSNNNNLSLTTIESKYFRNILAANERNNNLVSSDTIKGRLRQLRKLLEWLYLEIHISNQIPIQIIDRYKKSILVIKNDERALNLTKRTNITISFEESVIPDSVFSELLRIIKPNSPDNPFKKSKLRNYLIVLLLIETGIRRGSLAKLKISDCQFHGSYDRISLYKTENDRTDCRLNRAKHKTKPHISIVCKNVMRALKLYIDTVRLSFPQSSTHDFIFVSEKNSRGTLGFPLSLNSINQIFIILSEALNFKIHPHKLRHKWNEILDNKAEKINISGEQLEDIRKYAMGWSQNSTMNQIYNDKSIAKKTREISLIHQEEINENK